MSSVLSLGTAESHTQDSCVQDKITMALRMSISFGTQG